MKVQDVKKECLATVGLSIEFSNSEVSSISKLLTKVQDAVNVAKTFAKTAAISTNKQCDENDTISAEIDLKSLKRIEWLLIMMTRRDDSGLFDLADADYRAELSYINNRPAKSE